jgi:hypothetical protein
VTLTCFEDYRDRMLSIMTDADARTPDAAPADTAMLDLARARMARLLTAYHLFAERELFTPCAAVATPARRLQLRAIAADCTAIATDFRAFTKACAGQSVRNAWALYRMEATEFRVRIRRHLREVEDEVLHGMEMTIVASYSSPIGHRPTAHAA